MNLQVFIVLGQRCMLDTETMRVLAKFLNMHAREPGHKRKSRDKKTNKAKRSRPACMPTSKYGLFTLISLRTLAIMNKLRKRMKE
jgi:hypothetical protein